jgi:hypothetical protein
MTKDNCQSSDNNSDRRKVVMSGRNYQKLHNVLSPAVVLNENDLIDGVRPFNTPETGSCSSDTSTKVS